MKVIKNIWKIIFSNMSTGRLLFVFVFTSTILFSCKSDFQNNDALPKQEIGSLIVTDYTISDSSLANCAILEIKTQKFFNEVCEKYIGVIIPNANLSVNPVFDELYSCQRNFELTTVELPDYIEKKGYSYFRINFFAVQPYYDIPMILKLHKEYLENDFSVYFFNNLKIEFIKSSSFKIRAFYYNEEVSINDARLKVNG